MDWFIKFNCPYFATVPLDHVSSLGMFIVFFLIGVPALGTIIFTGNFETVASPRLPDSPVVNPNSTNTYRETSLCPSLARYIVVHTFKDLKSY